MLYIKKEVEQITGVPARLIQFYTESGLLHLDNINTGRGNARKYSKNDIIELMIIGILGKYGVTLSKVKHIMSRMPMIDELKHISHICIYGNGNLLYTKSKPELKAASENCSSILIIDIDKIQDQLKELQ